MFERAEKILKILSAGLAVLLVFQAASVLARKNPLENVTVPLPPSAPAKPEEKPKSEGESRPVPARASSLPARIQARIEKIKNSEILGPVIRPPPMALLGIFGHDALLRGTNGQSGLVREGEQFGGIKLLRIGTNRVLIEHEGLPKELTVFSGFGSESLLPKGKEQHETLR